MYRKMISYIYEYNNGKKGKNVGFVRVAVQNDSYKVNVQLNSDSWTGGTLEVYGFVRGAGGIVLSLFGNCRMDHGMGRGIYTGFTYDRWKKYRFLDMNGFFVVEQGGLEKEQPSVFFASQWDEEPIVWEDFARTQTAQEQTEEKMPHSKENEERRSALHIAEVEEQSEDQQLHLKSCEEKSSALHAIQTEEWSEEKGGALHIAEVEEKSEGELLENEETQETEPVQGLGQTGYGTPEYVVHHQMQEREGKDAACMQVSVLKQSTQEQDREEDEETEPVQNVEKAERIQKQEAQQSAQEAENTEIIETDLGEVKQSEQQERETEKPVQFSGEDASVYVEQDLQEENQWDLFEQRRAYLQKQYDTMKQESGNQTKKNIWSKGEDLLKQFPKLNPFFDQEVEASVRMEPKDLGSFPMEFWFLANNSFLLHGYYAYRHLLFMKMQNDQEYRYAIGVPGNCDYREKFMANMFGFEQFKSVQNKEKVGFGYWWFRLH